METQWISFIVLISAALIIEATAQTQSTWMKETQDYLNDNFNHSDQYGDFIALSSRSSLITFTSGDITRVLEGSTIQLDVIITCRNCTNSTQIIFTMEDEKTAKISTSNSTLIPLKGGEHIASMNISGIFIGMTSLHIAIVMDGDVIISVDHMVFVAREQKFIDKLFNYLLTIFIIMANITFGCELDLVKLKGYFKKPIGILTGVFCQYGFMPALAVSSSILGKLENIYAFGLLAYGCSPGGGASNVWTVLLGGDINLSLTMTLTSLIFSFVFMPIWLYTIGKRFSTEEANIPFANILLYMSFLLIPTGIGIAIRRFKKNIAIGLIKYLRPIAIIIILTLIVVGLYINQFVFVLMARLGFRLVIPSVAIPWCGFLISLGFALLLRQSWTCAKTIAIETGIQNLGIALVLLRHSLPSPESEIATTPALIAGMLATLPLFILAFVRKIYFCVQSRFCPEEETDKDIEKEGTDNPAWASDRKSTDATGEVQNHSGHENHRDQTQL